MAIRESRAVTPECPAVRAVSIRATSDGAIAPSRRNTPLAPVSAADGSDARRRFVPSQIVQLTAKVNRKKATSTLETLFEAQNFEGLRRREAFGATDRNSQPRSLRGIDQRIGIDKLKERFQRSKARELRRCHCRARG